MTYPHQPGQQPYQQPVYQPSPQQMHTVTTSGIPAWMHVLYAIGTVFTCGLLGIVWVLHWWFTKSKSSSTVTYQQGGYPAYPQPPTQMPAQQHYPQHGLPPGQQQYPPQQHS